MIIGHGKVKAGKFEVTDTENKTNEYKAENIIIATGARSRELPNLKQNGTNVIGYREAMTF